MGAVAAVAGGVPAMCDGVTQGAGRHGAVADEPRRDRHVDRRRLSHNMFDGALFLGICDKIVPGLVMAALSFGQRPHCSCLPAR